MNLNKLSEMSEEELEEVQEIIIKELSKFVLKELELGQKVKIKAPNKSYKFNNKIATVTTIMQGTNGLRTVKVLLPNNEPIIVDMRYLRKT